MTNERAQSHAVTFGSDRVKTGSISRNIGATGLIFGENADLRCNILFPPTPKKIDFFFGAAGNKRLFAVVGWGGRGGQGWGGWVDFQAPLGAGPLVQGYPQRSKLTSLYSILALNSLLIHPPPAFVQG